MLNHDKPVGQRIGDGAFLGAPPGTTLWTDQSLYGHHLQRDLSNPRAKFTAPVIKQITSFGWLDRVGMPHGRTGDKIIRKAMKGTIGLRGRRGPFAGWHMSTLRASKGARHG